MKRAAAIWLLWTAGVAAQTPPQPAPIQATSPGTPPGPSLPGSTVSQQEDRRRFRRSGGEDSTVVRPDLSADFDAFAPDDTPAPERPRFDPRRPSLAPEADPLAALIRNGPGGAALSSSQSPEPWMLPGVRRVPTLADPPPGSAPATRIVRPSAPAG